MGFWERFKELFGTDESDKFMPTARIVVKNLDSQSIAGHEKRNLAYDSISEQALELGITILKWAIYKAIERAVSENRKG